MKTIVESTFLAFASLCLAAPAEQHEIHLVWMGGNDCPACVQWRATELPKLEQSAAFSSMKFHFVPKVVASGVPAKLFLPSDVQKYKDILDEANAGRGGSPQGALIVDDIVYDYFLGVRSAEDIERMIESVTSGTKYPFRRCLRVNPSRSVRQCELKAN